MIQVCSENICVEIRCLCKRVHIFLSCSAVLALLFFVMKPFCATLLVALHWQALTSCAHRQYPLSDAVPSDTSMRRDPSSSETWHEKYGTQPDLAFTGPLAFSHLPYIRCLEDASPAFDIALLGMPFDTAVTYRPGARFGPQGIRVGSRRSFRSYFAWSLSWRLDPYQQGLEIIDCGDVSVSRMYISICLP
jgi:agmatinase